MLKNIYHAQMQSSRAGEKNLSIYKDVQVKDIEAFINIQAATLQLCDRCGVKKSTKYLIKRTLDTYVLKFPLSSPEQLSFASVNFFRIASKIYQDSIKFENIPIEFCNQLIGGQYLHQDYINFELQFYNQPEFNMNFTTPDNYLKLIADIFFLNEKQIKKINNILDLSYTIPQLMFNSAEELFFGCILFALQEKPTLVGLIISQSFYQEESRNASELIKLYYEQPDPQVQAALIVQFQ